jgi:hypothetical protein
MPREQQQQHVSCMAPWSQPWTGRSVPDSCATAFLVVPPSHRPSNGPMFLVKYCNLTSLLYLWTGVLACHMCLRGSPFAEFPISSTTPHSVSNVHARLSESSARCPCGAPRLSHIKHWYQRRYSATKSETLILLSVSQILLCASDRSQPSRTALPRNAST